MRLVICDGIQYDADRLPRHVDASKCVPADEWFAKNRTSKADSPAGKAIAEPPAVEKPAQSKSSRRRGDKSR